jgi:hypothetical protein
MIDPAKQDWKSPTSMAMDEQPDERGNVTLVALFQGGRMIALGFNAN